MLCNILDYITAAYNIVHCQVSGLTESLKTSSCVHEAHNLDLYLYSPHSRWVVWPGYEATHNLDLRSCTEETHSNRSKGCGMLIAF